LIMARTDANATDGLDEALRRCEMFRKVGVDITFLEAPKDEDEMRRYGAEIDGPKMANMVEQGATPYLSPKDLEEIGYKVAIYPAALLTTAIKGMQETLQMIKSGEQDLSNRITFQELQAIVGFPEYYADEKQYAAE
jgi:2-methylisocitrate lyase-like PEP mutase family enzyme